MSETSGSPATGLVEQTGNWLFKWRNLVLPLIVLALLFGFRPVPHGGDARLDHWMDAAGVLLALMGQSMRAATIGYRYIVRGGKKGKVYADDLVTEGMFAHCRNPLYVGNLLVLFGLFVIHNNPWVYAIGIPTFAFFYLAIVQAEETYLRGRFGDAYVQYCRRVPRWIPDWRGFHNSIDGIPFNWEEVVYTEFGSTYTWTVTALGILAYEVMQQPPGPDRGFFLAIVGCLFVLATVTWVGWRYWKRWLTARKRQEGALNQQR